MLYFGNVFSPSAIGNSFSCVSMRDKVSEYQVHVRILDAEEAADLLHKAKEWSSCVGDAGIAAILTRVLGVEIPLNRISVKLGEEDELLVAQYVGPRLPERAEFKFKLLTFSV